MRGLQRYLTRRTCGVIILSTQISELFSQHVLEVGLADIDSIVAVEGSNKNVYQKDVKKTKKQTCLWQTNQRLAIWAPPQPQSFCIAPRRSANHPTQKRRMQYSRAWSTTASQPSPERLAFYSPRKRSTKKRRILMSEDTRRYLTYRQQDIPTTDTFPILFSV